jgi:SPRY domain-containing SOCS box protein 3
MMFFFSQMIGIGTDKVDLREHQYRFTSPLGLDDQSYGYSYRGLIQHAGCLKYYGKKYTRGCIVGVHLNLKTGTMEFYLNRRTQGLAFTGISLDPTVSYFPMACSTSAKSVIKLINATSYPDNLQFNCMRRVARNPKMLNVSFLTNRAE